MSWIEFFGLVVKPKLVKGKYMLAPISDREIKPHLYALRDKDVNAFVYEKEGCSIAIDCGY